MLNHHDPDEPNLRLDHLSVCRTCSCIYGNVVYTLSVTAQPERRQHCDCQPVERSTDRCDEGVHEAMVLCRCCGRRALTNHHRRSVWFCRACLRAIQAINQACGTHVLPHGRQSLLEEIGLAEDADARPVPAFIESLGDWFERLERLETHAWLVVQDNIRLLNPTPSINEVSLSEYLERLPASPEMSRASVFDLGRAFNVPPYLLSDAVRAIE